MGLFDLFRSKGGDDDGSKAARDANRWADKVANKRLQPGDRGEAIDALVKQATPQAAGALLHRFTFNIDPSITDQEEKDVAFDGVVAAGKDAVPVIREFCAKAESVAWPLRALRELLSTEDYVAEVLGLLSAWDTEYSKFVDPKLQLLAALEDQKDPRITPALLEFLEDVNETARFHAAASILAQEDPSAIDALCTAFELEESARVQKRIAEGFVKLGWKVPEERLSKVRSSLPHEWSLDDDGSFVNHG